MKNIALNRLFTLFVLLFFLVKPLSALNIAGGHRGSVTALVHNGDTIISAGEDGFIVIWNIREQAAAERFQLTKGSIQAMVKNPVRDEICVLESGGIDVYRISVWNYRFKIKLFSLQSAEPVTYVNYSAGGNFIIASGLGGAALTQLDSGTGRIISTPGIPYGAVSLAATGRSERNILLYQSRHEDYSPLSRTEREGQILYLDMDSLSVTDRFQAPADLISPIIFGNNRFIAGINSSGLLIVDAATGAVFDSFQNIRRGALLCPADDGFYCLFREGGAPVLYKFTFERQRNIFSSQKLSVSFDPAVQVTSIAFNGNAAFASAEGSLFLLGRNNRIVPMAHNFQARIMEIAHSGSSIVFLTENSELCFLPLDYRLLENSGKITLENKSGYTRITPITSLLRESTDQYILWQSANTRIAPHIIFSDRQADAVGLSYITGRFSLRSISSKNNKLLVLDTAGNIAVYNLDKLSADNLPADFTFSSIGAIDASLVDGDHFILCRSVISGNSPFLSVNIKTGETVPFSYPAQAGVTAYAGNSGNIYAAAVEWDIDGERTVVFNLSAAEETRIFEYPGEDVHLSIAESAGTLAIAGGQGAAVYRHDVINFERTNGLPEKLLGSERFFICLDSEGNISWHDNMTGKLLALFRLYEDRWTLSSNREISGPILRP